MEPEQFAILIKSINGVQEILWWVALWGFCRIFS